MFYKHQEVPQNTIAQMRKAAKLTQADLAEAVGVTRQTIIAIEKGNYTPSVLLALKLAQALSKRVEELFSL
jgi:putative transcriptional regulator